MSEEKKVTSWTRDPKNVLEGKKLIFETFKHLTTLSTAAILILVTFLEKFFTNSHWKSLIVVAFSAFILSAFTSVITMLSVAIVLRSENTARADITARIGCMSLLLTFGSFFTGIISLVLFVIKNFY